MSKTGQPMRGWFRAVARAPANLVSDSVQHTIRLKRLFSISTRAVDARAKLDGMEKAVLAQRRQLGDAKLGMSEAEQALASLQDELSGLTKDFGDLGRNR